MTEHASDHGVSGRFEPSLNLKFLPKCPNCGTRHPLAFQPPIRDGLCPECGVGREDGEDVSVPAVATLPLTARACLAVGRFLRRFQEKM